MGTVEKVFAIVVGVLAALAVIGALVFAVAWEWGAWEWGAIRRTLAAHRRLAPEEMFWRDRTAVSIPGRRP
jgi:hypothetical protein